MNKQIKKEKGLELPFYYKAVTINILIIFGLLTGGVLLFLPMILIWKKDNRLEEIEEKYDECEKELSESYEKKTFELEIDYDEKFVELHSFADKYFDEHFIERRDKVLLEQLNYTPIEERFSLSSEYKDKMKSLELKEKELIRTGEYFTGFHKNGAKKSEIAKVKKMLISGFNAIIDNEIDKVTIKNYNSKKKKIKKIIEQFNEGINLINPSMKVSSKIARIKLLKLELMLEYKEKVEDEKEQIKEAREREKEEKKINALLEKEIEKIEQEKTKLARQKEVYFERMSTESSEDMKKAILAEIEKLNEQETKLNDNEKSLEEKKKLSGAGYVYVISNVGSFGEEVYKIGMTRRQEPLDRVKELGSASVPFLFDVHALIYSKNAYELENALHKEFASKRVNKVNKRKEFFKVKLEEIKEVVLENYNGTVEFIETAEAIEYRESLLRDE